MNLRSILPEMSRNMVYCDVGARGGIGEPWKTFRDFIDLVGFEPDEEEYDRIMAFKSDNDTFFKYALSKERGNILLNLTRSRGASSVLKPNRDFLDNFPNSERFEVEKIAVARSTTLDALHNDGVFPVIDFIKIDTQGCELDILKGGANFLKDHVLGLEVEVEFHPLYQGQPVFADIDLFVRGSVGLEIQDLRKTYWKYLEGVRVGGQKGKLIFGDALYFRSPNEVISWASRFSKKEASDKIRMACLMGIIYGYLDYSLSILKQPNIHDFVARDAVCGWISFISNYGRSLRYRGPGSSKLAGLFNMLYRIFQLEEGGWASAGHSLGMRKKFGIFY